MAMKTEKEMTDALIKELTTQREYLVNIVSGHAHIVTLQSKLSESRASNAALIEDMNGIMRELEAAERQVSRKKALNDELVNFAISLQSRIKELEAELATWTGEHK